MLRSVLRLLLAGLVSMPAVMPLMAHHEILAKFDSAKTRTLNGAVTKMDWVNPHVHVLVNVPDRARLVNWAVELESPLDLERSGWNRNSLKPGDAVTIQGIRARDGSLQVWGNSITLTNTGEKVLAMSAVTSMKRAAGNQPAKLTPRWPDGKPRLGTAPGETGYWAKPSSTSLMENGAVVATDGNALRKNIKDIDKVAPFQKWTLDMYEYR